MEESESMEIGPRVILWFDEEFPIKWLRGVEINESAFFAILVGIAMVIFAIVSTRKMKRDPKGIQGVAEAIVESIYNLVKSNMGVERLMFAPLIGTLFIFLAFSSAIGLFGFRAVTADMNATFAMSIMIFFVIQGAGIRKKGIGGYLHGFIEPYPFMFPIKFMEEFTLPISLAFRLFGNIFAGVFIIELIMEGLHWVSESLVHLPIPIFQTILPLPLNMFFDIFEPFLQAFVFSMLSMAFIVKGMSKH
ncbi:MAG: F0F1 ATP synthase subunit A [Clostridiales Family XIII bacterium]|jgi:F-type H+-transporting ATPase subunit a|nr:F0F1 ATP synthase subunit A [Clostridiales Family XIII bacterium]